MNYRSLSRHAITFFALTAILTQAAALAISDFGFADGFGGYAVVSHHEDHACAIGYGFDDLVVPIVSRDKDERCGALAGCVYFGRLPFIVRAALPIDQFDRSENGLSVAAD